MPAAHKSLRIQSGMLSSRSTVLCDAVRSDMLSSGDRMSGRCMSSIMSDRYDALHRCTVLRHRYELLRVAHWGAILLSAVDALQLVW